MSFSPAGEVFFPPSLSDKLTLQQAREACERHDAALASPGQLFAAWRAGLNRCDYGWLSDGSVRHPVTVPLPQCGGGLLGVRTLYKHKNQTGYPDPGERHGAFCFKGKDRSTSPKQEKPPEKRFKSNWICGGLFLLKLLKVLYIKTFSNFRTQSETKHLHTHENIKEHIKTLNGRMEITHSTGREIKPNKEKIKDIHHLLNPPSPFRGHGVAGGSGECGVQPGQVAGN